MINSETINREANKHQKKVKKGDRIKLFRNNCPTALMILLVFNSYSLSAQKEGENLIPNPGFEQYDRTPIGWFYNGSHFTKLVKYWSSPTEASPDAYGPEIFVPRHWQEKGFGWLKPFEGKAMVGITLFGCSSGKPHCREYLQIQLSEPIIPGQKYRFTLYAASLSQSILINNLGLALSTNPIRSHIDSVLKLESVGLSKQIFPTGRNQWEKLTLEFVGEFHEGYILIGNFSNDKETVFRKEGGNLNFAYYYIDNVSLIKLPPILPQPVRKDDFTLLDFKKGMKVSLEEIYFDVDQVHLHPRSLMELDKLIGILTKYPAMKIKIIGHTDNSGSKDYNLELSYKRADEVIKYLKAQGINETRLSSEGQGDSNPVISNKSDSGRSRNRRVEFEVVEL